MAEDPLKTLTDVLCFLGLDMIDAEGQKVQPNAFNSEEFALLFGGVGFVFVKGGSC